MTQQAEYKELFSWLRLVLTPGVGSKTAYKLLSTFGNAPDVFKQSYYALTQVVSAKQAQALTISPPDFEHACQTLESWLNKSSMHYAIELGHPDYPSSLLEIADPPLLIYASGQLKLLQNSAIAIVGSRHPTPQGRETAIDFARTLSQQGISIVSGLALGIDGISQEAALQGTGSTIAVLGTGIDRVYPASHHALAHEIATQGLLLSEYPLGTPPIASNFPKRNRIIAALTSGTLVVEATLRSGSLITARLAADMGKEVFAIPGSIHSPQSKGCHWLIRQGAKLVETAQDITEELGRVMTIPEQKPASYKQVTENPHPKEKQALARSCSSNLILKAIGEGPTSFDAIVSRTGCDTATLQAQLLTLELNQEIARLPGGLYQRLHLA